MTNKEASNVLRLFANLIEINGLPQDKIMIFRKAYEQAITELEYDKRPQGEWIIIDDTEQFIAKCSICGRIEDSRMIKDYPFCHCGADMRVDNEGT